MATLKIITSNIRFANPEDGIHDWPNRRPLLVNIFRSFNPDILGTQEGRIGQIKELDLELAELELIDQHREWIDERMYPCLFINSKTILVERSGDIWLSETPSTPGSSSFKSSFPRLCTWAEITVKETGKKYMVINTHLDHVLNTTRKEQIKVLITEVKKINDRPVLIMGDFNESPLTSIKSDLMKAFNLKDPWEELNYPEEASHHGFLGNESKSGDRIDWILIPKTHECSHLKLEKSAGLNGVFPSDHYPLLATVIPK